MVSKTTVTAISTTDEGIFANMNDDDAGKMAKDRINYWKRFASVMSDSGCVFDPRITPIKSTHSSGSLARKHRDILQLCRIRDVYEFQFSSQAGNKCW